MQTRNRHLDRKQTRRGFSLVELLIVMAVLAAVAGLTLPAMRGPLDKSRLTSAARQVQATLAKARALAIRESAVVQFRYEVAGDEFVIERLPLPQQMNITVLDDAGGTTNTPSGLTEEPTQPVIPFSGSSAELPGFSGSGTAQVDGGAGTVILREGQLPTGVTFSEPVSTDTTDGTGSLAGDSEVTQGIPVVSTPQWSEPVVFQPGGRTTDRVIRLNGQRNFFVEVTLRGLTGMAGYSAPARVVSPLPDPGTTPSGAAE